MNDIVKNMSNICYVTEDQMFPDVLYFPNNSNQKFRYFKSPVESYEERAELAYLNNNNLHIGTYSNLI